MHENMVKGLEVKREDKKPYAKPFISHTAMIIIGTDKKKQTMRCEVPMRISVKP